ncbi:MAG TPA: hypothetical protein VLA48_02850 [Nitrososphaeraceae archaeon]|nr:hypothetical protein [Nitrososphaeraceae archaeon]
MKLSISTFKIICYLWNSPEEILEDEEFLNNSLYLIDNIAFSTEEKETAKEEIKQLIETL